MSLVLTFFLPVISALEFKWSTNLDYVWVSDPTTWNDAEDYCVNKFGTHLASIHDATQNTAVDNLCGANAGNHCFIGQNDIEILHEWVWSDGTVLDFSYRVTHTGDLSDHCMVILSGDDLFIGDWRDVYCNYDDSPLFVPYTFICNAPLQIELFSANNNYIWVGPNAVNFSTANNFCKSQYNTSLASIHSEAGNTEIGDLCSLYSANSACYIGLNDIDTEGNYVWIDGSALDYTPTTWVTDNADHGGFDEDCTLISGSNAWGDSPCHTLTYSTPICNAPSCEVTGEIMHIDWDLIVNDVNDDQVPYYNVTVHVNEVDLTVSIDADLGYLGNSYADNGIYGFGSTYFISLNSFSSDTLDIFSNNGLSECDNREPLSFVNKSFAEKWEYSETPYFSGHVDSYSYLAYPPSGNYWDLTAFGIDSGNKCDRINYFGSFSWDDLQNKCNNPQTTDSSVEILTDNDWINLTGTIYINIVSPLYKDIDSGMYRIYELTNEQFTIAVSKSVHVLAAKGISLYKISIIAV
eukprot:401912_1